MAEKSNVFESTIKHEGYWHYRALYSFCYNWLKEEGYDLYEDQYTEKITGDGKEIEIKWKAKKKVSDYFRNIIELKWHILRMQDAEVEIDGKKKKMNKGEVKIKFSADLERDYEARWEDKPFWKFLRATYDKYIIKTTMDEYEDRLTAKTGKYTEEVKAFLNLEGRQ